jgi:galactose mutarotase-like enzyme
MNSPIRLHVGIAEAMIDLQGGYVHSWSIDGAHILYAGKDAKRRGIPLLFPYFGKPDPALPQHGFARDMCWRLDISSANFASIVLSNSDISDAARIYYPYPFEVYVDIELSHSTLTYTLRVTNTGLKDMPISPGLHPYWAVPHAQKKTYANQRNRGLRCIIH